MKALLGLLLSLSLGSCPLVMGAAMAGRPDAHACCPAPEQPAAEAQCCVTAAAPSTVALAAPSFVAVALPHAAPLPASPARGTALAAETLAPPGPAPSDGPSSRAPPAVLA